MINHHQTAVTRVVFRDGNHAVRCRMDRSAVVRGHVHARMERTFSAEGIEALAEAIRDVAHHRPNRRRVGGIREAQWGKQMESAAGNSDHRSIALQEGVLLDGTVERVLRVRRVVALIERRGMIPQHAVGHGYFSRERLEGIEALVGIVDGGLQLAVLLGSRFQFVPHCVVITDFPEHPGVRRHGGGYADSANQSQNGDPVY